MAINVACGGCRNRTYGPVLPVYTLAMCCITALPGHLKPPTLTSKRKTNLQKHYEFYPISMKKEN